jgi:hypothetical protein
VPTSIALHPDHPSYARQTQIESAGLDRHAEQLSVTHSIANLIQVVHAHFPVGQARPGADPNDFPPPGFHETEGQRRLIEARKKAGENKSMWSDVLRRISSLLPGYQIVNGSLHLPTGRLDSAYVANVSLPLRKPLQEQHELRLAVSFLVPHFAIAASTCTYTAGYKKPEPTEPKLTATVAIPEPEVDYVVYLPSNGELPTVFPEYEYHFDLDSDEQACAEVIVGVIEEAFPGYTLLPPEVGGVRLPDVITDFKPHGEATIYDCLFTHQW